MCLFFSDSFLAGPSNAETSYEVQENVDEVMDQDVMNIENQNENHNDTEIPIRQKSKKSKKNDNINLFKFRHLFIDENRNNKPSHEVDSIVDETEQIENDFNAVPEIVIKR